MLFAETFSIVATWQSLQHQDRINLYNPDEFKVIIVDEAHHAASPAYVMGQCCAHAEFQISQGAPFFQR